MADSAQLVMSQGPQPGQTFVLDQDSLTVGRDPHNDISISDPQISRQHARIVRRGDQMVIEDMGSTNGTYINGLRLSGPHTLASGDVIGLGDVVTLTYHTVSPSATEPLAGRATIPLGRQPRYETPPAPPAYEPAPSSAYAPTPSVPPAYAAAPTPAPEPAPPKKRRVGLWIGCGCLVLLVVLACVAVFVLDYFQMLPPIFYEPLRWLGLI
jgi:pSer/pThr/pTyr-binding forkhead associated (FHA) protein